PRVVQHRQHALAFGGVQGPRVATVALVDRRRAGRSGAFPVPPVVGRPRPADRPARAGRADFRHERGERFLGQPFGFFGEGRFSSGAPSDSFSKSAASFPCTSITNWAFASSFSSRSFFARSFSSSLSRSSA